MTSGPERMLNLLLAAHDLTEGMEQEYRFDPGRRWRIDFAWPGSKLAVEVEGGAWTGGRHTRGSGFTKDCEKYNHLALMGWRLLRFTPDMIESGEAVETIIKALSHEII